MNKKEPSANERARRELNRQAAKTAGEVMEEYSARLPKIEYSGSEGLPPGSYSITSKDLDFDAKGQPRLRPDAKPVPISHTAGRPMKRVQKSPLDDHPRAAETRRLMREARIDDEVEVMDLQASEVACTVADRWVEAKGSMSLEYDDHGKVSELWNGLDRLELVTRPSAMRKVRP